MWSKSNFLRAIATSVIISAIATPSSMYADEVIEIRRSPQSSFSNPIKIPTALDPAKKNILFEAQPTVTPVPNPRPDILNLSTTIPFNSAIAVLVPPPAKDTFPYLVIVPSSDPTTLNRVLSIVPTAKIIPSRFGNIVMVQGYPDRDRAEVLKTIVRSAIGLDARVIHQNTL